MDFRAILKDKRNNKHITQFELAEMIGVSPEAVSRWETGKRKITLENAEAALAALGYRFEIVEDKT